MAFEVENFENLLGLNGFSNQLLQNHFILYGGYVKNTNKLVDLLNEMLKEGKTGTPEFAEIKRRFGWEFNGMRLHEYYFGNMTKEQTKLLTDSDLYKKIKEDFGSQEDWEKDFKATGAMRGIGWVILYLDKKGNKLFNTWINEHDVGHPAGGIPLLVMDVFEHAFMLDYGTKKAGYIDAFFDVINWKKIESRFANK